MAKPVFIVIEGIDGSGKSTQIELLQHRMSEEGKQVAITGEPTDGFIGKIIRDIMRGKEETDPAVVAALYVADRMDHITHPDVGMLALLEKGYNIIASRYYFSSYAFQGEYVSLEWLIHANSICKSRLKADLTVYINIDPAI
ncbi:MAG TPA: dTMP kinase, partial [Saprospiraceae bacterium]|nr:dTMP kinase [Saprospiraceae bacterium]